MEFNCQERGAEQLILLKWSVSGDSHLCLSSHQPLFSTVSSLFIECNFTTAFEGQTPLRAHHWSLRMCSSLQGYFLCLKLISYNYKCLIFPESSNIGLHLSTAQSGDDYKRGMWTSNIIRFASSPARMIFFYLYRESVRLAQEVFVQCREQDCLCSLLQTCRKILPIREIFIATLCYSLKHTCAIGGGLIKHVTEMLLWVVRCALRKMAL